jgi:hypothetical protein
LLLATSLLAACGSPPTSLETPGRTAAKLVAPQQPSTGPANPDAEILAKLASGLNGVSFMTGTVTFKEFGDGGKEEHGTAQFTFRRSPFAARVDIEDSNRLLAAGTAVLWTGGNSVQVRRKGIPLTLTFPADHSLVVSVRGWRLDQTDIFAMGKIALAPGAEVKSLGRVKVEDGDRVMLEVKSPASMPGITREKIGLDPTTFIPTYRAMYVGTTLVHKGIGRKLVLNRTIDPERFKL